MSTRRKIFFGIILLLSITSILLFWLSQKNKKTDNNQPETNQNTAKKELPIIHGEKPATAIDTFTIATQTGTVAVNNIYKLPDAKPLDLDGVNFKNTQYYYMAYYPKQQGFIIAMMDPNIQKAREIAESDFLDILGITKDQACQLNVSLTVPPTVNETASGGNYGLSFCPGETEFPN
ncbi:MAG: hypothetical protein WC848_01875 [Parcubacteria group bacterium]|jgi:hypothetical protein